MILFVCKAHFVASIGSFGLLVLAIAGALFITAAVCVLYLAIEPYVRRRWPHAIISWTRLLSGRLRDPLVGRDMMVGSILGISWGIAYYVLFIEGRRYGFPPNVNWGDFMLGPRTVLGAWIWHVANSVQATLGMFFLMFVFRVLLRKPWLAAIAFIGLWTAIKFVGSSHGPLLVPVQLFVYSGAAFVLLRYGALSLATGIFVADILLNVAITSHPSAWYYGGTWFVLLTVVALACWAFYIALAGQKLWKASLFD
jgi:hypothetical protein